MLIRTWRGITDWISPLGYVTAELLFERDLRSEIDLAKAKIDIAVQEARATEIDYLAELVADEPYLYLEDRESGAIGGHTRSRAIQILQEAYWARMERGEKCFLALAGNKIAHVNWLCFSWGDALPFRPFILNAGEVYTTDAYTVPAYRGANIHAAVLSKMLFTARQLGRERAYTLASFDRPISYRIFPALGWRKCGSLICILPRGARQSTIVRLSGWIDPVLREAPAEVAG